MTLTHPTSVAFLFYRKIERHINTTLVLLAEKSSVFWISLYLRHPLLGNIAQGPHPHFSRCIWSRAPAGCLPYNACLDIEGNQNTWQKCQLTYFYANKIIIFCWSLSICKMFYIYIFYIWYFIVLDLSNNPATNLHISPRPEGLKCFFLKDLYQHIYTAY